MEKRKVILVDDQNLFPGGLKQMLEKEGDIQIINIIKRANDVLFELRHQLPDVLMLDLNMPDKNGFEVLKEVRAEFPDLTIAVLSTHDKKLFVKKARLLKATGYFSKDATIQELREFILEEQHNKFVMSKGLEREANTVRSDFDNFVRIMELTERETEIVKLIAKGDETKEIAEELFLSIWTVKTHRKNIYKKLNIKNQSELLKIVYENKFIQ
ncbi:MAG: response regulator transcription factor [Bacteroidota bacterium]|nr:response regulator transcription factor [Bacteroidota bacterium]